MIIISTPEMWERPSYLTYEVALANEMRVPIYIYYDDEENTHAEMLEAKLQGTNGLRLLLVGTEIETLDTIMLYCTVVYCVCTLYCTVL